MAFRSLLRLLPRGREAVKEGARRQAQEQQRWGSAGAAWAAWGSRHHSTVPAPPPAAAGSTAAASTAEEDVVKSILIEQQKQFRSYLEGLSTVSIPLNPDDSKAVTDYTEAIRSLREKAGMPSLSQRMEEMLEAAEEDAKDVRGFLLTSQSLRRELGIDDSLGVEPLVFAALDNTEQKIGRPLSLKTADGEGLQTFYDELEVVARKLGLEGGELEDVEEELGRAEGELELEQVRAEVAQLRTEALDQINTYKRRDGLEDIEVDLKELNPTAHL